MVTKAIDGIQQRLADYAYGLRYEDISGAAMHAAKVRVIDTLAALVGGFFAEPCRIARNLAAATPMTDGSTIIGTRMQTTPDMAAFVNGTTARYLEINDLYHWPGSSGGHASDMITPLLGIGEHARVGGRDFITSVVLAYEVFLRISDVFHTRGFDVTNFCCLGTAVAAGKLFGFTPEQLAHCISMAVVPNNILRQVRTGHLSMWKGVASGYAARSGVFAALLARMGMEGPHLPFEGKAGWCDHVARERFTLDTLGGNGTPFKILDTRIKHRPSSATNISSVLAAEKVAPLKNVKDVKEVIVEVHRKAKEDVGTGEHQWHPDCRETADHSAPYVVAATLIDGTLTPRSFNDAHLWNPELRALMQKITVVENEEFTRAYERLPMEHRTRVTVLTAGGERLVGEAGGAEGDIAAAKTDAEIEEKFRGLTEDVLGATRVSAILKRLWQLEELNNVAEIPPAFVLD